MKITLIRWKKKRKERISTVKKLQTRMLLLLIIHLWAAKNCASIGIFTANILKVSIREHIELSIAKLHGKYISPRRLIRALFSLHTCCIGIYWKNIQAEVKSPRCTLCYNNNNEIFYIYFIIFWVTDSLHEFKKKKVSIKLTLKSCKSN